jgi:hypothetical protein
MTESMLLLRCKMGAQAPSRRERGCVTCADVRILRSVWLVGVVERVGLEEC